ncbi:hypothetical protein SK128_013582 [Halocaridina rubra]|uniref:Neurotransmitter-gated ion-channel ligand-binding domain-containing protein n=1 Tax=Halocaridina rubra TaxID=373956 RepID=A0AAN8WX28_HALRR
MSHLLRTETVIRLWLIIGIWKIRYATSIVSAVQRSDGLMIGSSRSSIPDPLGDLDSFTVYDLVPEGEADNVTRIQLNNFKEAFETSDLEEGHLTVAAAIRSEKMLSWRFRPEPFKWYHVCIVIAKSENDNSQGCEDQTACGNNIVSYFLTVYLNGTRMGRLVLLDPLPMDGSLIIGQKQDKSGGGFKVSYSLIGSVSIAIYPDALGVTDIISLFNCDGRMTLQSVMWEFHGFVVFSSERICVRRENTVLTMSLTANKTLQALDNCKMIGMQLALPESQEQNTALTTVLSQSNFCSGAPFNDQRLGFLGLLSEEVLNGVIDKANLPPFVQSRIEALNLTNSSLMLTEEGIWMAHSQAPGCPLCFGIPTGRFIMRGLCNVEVGNPMEYMIYYPRINGDGALGLYSLSGVTIQRDREWQMIYQSRIIATSTDANILGRHPWQITGSVNFCRAANLELASGTSLITITVCSNDQYTCASGQCVSQEARCNIQYECDDHTDEDDCQKSTFDRATYSKITIPDERPLHIDVKIILRKVTSVDIISETVQMVTTIIMEWHDNRLTLINLSDDPNVNFLGNFLGDFWLPLIHIKNEATLSGTSEAHVRLQAVRRGKPVRVGKNFHFQGSENPLQYWIKQAHSLYCQFYVRDFPFDTQKCWLNISVFNIPKEFINITAIILTEDLFLSEYSIVETMLYVEHRLMKLAITFRRLPEYHFFTTYFPVMLLHAIGYGTLFIDADDFTNRGGMSLTALLVLISLYSDTLTSLPRTSYLKSIDIWYIFSIGFLSLIIAVHLATNKVTMPTISIPLDSTTRYPLPEVLPVNSVSSKNLSANAIHPHARTKRKILTNANILRMSRVLFLIIYIAFFVWYWLPYIQSRINSKEVPLKEAIEVPDEQ